MIKQVIALILLSIATVFAMSYAQQAVQYLLNAHEWVSQVLTDVFSGGQTGNLLRGSIALLSVPVLVGCASAAIYWMARRHWFPYFMQVVWIAWLIQVGALVITYKAIVVG